MLEVLDRTSKLPLIQEKVVRIARTMEKNSKGMLPCQVGHRISRVF